MSGPRPSELRCFHENSPRPPVPGEEREGYYGSQQPRSAQSQLRSSQQSAAADSQPRRIIAASTCDAIGAPLGFEPEGRASDRSVAMEAVERSSPQQAHGEASESHRVLHKWTQSLHALLEDPKGLELFEQYLQQEGHSNELPFYFACEGLKEERDPTKLTAIIKVLIRRFLQRPEIALPDKMRKEMTRRYREGQADKCMFRDAQIMIGRLIEETKYPSFLRSEVYRKYAERCQRADAIGTPSSGRTRQSARLDDERESLGSSPDELSVSCASSALPPLLEEDTEIHQKQPHHSSSHHQHHHHHHHTTAKPSSSTTTANDAIRLTKDALMATQQIRVLDVRPKPEAYAGMYLTPPGASPYHTKKVVYVPSYNPVSRQDSELQSLSSDARTESDNLSLTDASLSSDNPPAAKRNARKPSSSYLRSVKKSSIMNRESIGCPEPYHIQRSDSRIPKSQPLPRDEFAKQLIAKLERLIQDRENREKLDRMTARDGEAPSSSDVATLSGDATCYVFQSAPRPQESQLEEDSETQAILDQHVQRVWNDQTPSRSPKVSSPRPRSPDKCRRQQQQQHPSRPASYRSQRKEKDVFSTFSGDSGNVHDLSEAGELHGAGSMSSLGSHLPKSKSVPSDYADSLNTQADLYLQGPNQQHYRRMDAQQRSSATKKSMTELTDSGVSVVSDPTVSKGSRAAMNWYGKDAAAAKTEMNVMKVTRKKYPDEPLQPFIGVSGMPLLPQPNIDTQLEEAKRRLEFETNRSRPERQQRYTSNVELMSPSSQQPTSCCPVQPSNQSTLRRAGKQEVASEFTTVVFSFCEEKVPYRTKIPGHDVTLKQFKDVLPKKGNYRYFFRTACEDLDMQVIQEEVTEETEVLPLWEGKIMATVKALE